MELDQSLQDGIAFVELAAYLAIREKPAIANQTSDVTEWLKGDEFNRVVGSDGANAIGRLKKRLYFVRDRLLGV